MVINLRFGIPASTTVKLITLVKKWGALRGVINFVVLAGCRRHPGQYHSKINYPGYLEILTIFSAASSVLNAPVNPAL